eukprot:jgi/Mesvir1/27681/Mv07400-RA.1
MVGLEGNNTYEDPENTDGDDYVRSYSPYPQDDSPSSEPLADSGSSPGEGLHKPFNPATTPTTSGVSTGSTVTDSIKDTIRGVGSAANDDNELPESSAATSGSPQHAAKRDAFAGKPLDLKTAPLNEPAGSTAEAAGTVASDSLTATVRDRAREDIRVQLIQTYGHWEQPLLRVRKCLLWTSVPAGAASAAILVGVHLALWYGAVLIDKVGLVTLLSLLAMLFTVVAYLLSLVGINISHWTSSRSKQTEGASSKAAPTVVPPRPTNADGVVAACHLIMRKGDVTFPDLAHLYVELLFAAKEANTQVQKRVLDGSRVKGKVVLAVLLALGFVAILGQVLSGFFMLWSSVFSILLAPPVLGHGLLAPLARKLSPHMDKVLQFIDTHIGVNGKAKVA